MSTIAKLMFLNLSLCCLACGLPEAPDEQGAYQQYDNTRLAVHGVARFDGVPIQDVRVLIVPEFGQNYMSYETLTDADGAFTVPLNRGGVYTIVAQAETNEGLITAALEKEYISDDTPFVDLGNVALGYVNMNQYESTDSADGISTTEQALGVGWRCLRAGCSTRCGGGVKFMCCGYSACIAGFEGCVPYGRC